MEPWRIKPVESVVWKFLHWYLSSIVATKDEKEVKSPELIKRIKQ
jgi:hypothetical protein